MRIATYNVEWFNALFDENGALLADAGWSSRRDVTRAQQIEALAIVFSALDADMVMVVEAPDDRGRHATVPMLEEFAATFDLRACRAVTGFESATQQEIACLYDPEAVTLRHAPWGEGSGKKGSLEAPRFDGVFRIDLDIDAEEDLVRFSKPPLELQAETAAGVSFRMIGVHLKSKAPHGAHTRDEVISRSIANRRKQQAQAVWLRQRIAQHLEAGQSLIVLGDLNDGPGLDAYENLFGRSSVEIIMGEGLPPEQRLYDPHARQALTHPLGARKTTSRFFISREQG